MGYEELSLSGFVKEISEVTKGTHPRKFCFVLGAGASRSSGIKSGQDLVKIWDKELQIRNMKDYTAWRESLSITDDNMFSFYSQYYEKRFMRCPGDGYNYIEKIMESAKPSAGYVMLAHMLTETPHRVVITTNFDHLTEDAVNYYAQGTPLVIGHEFLAHYISSNPVRPTIIKIHRDLLLDPKSRSEDLEQLPENWKRSLGMIFENYHPIFIGYAGNDKSLMDYLLENAQKFANDEWKYPYWMIYEGDALEGKILGFLSQSNGYVIHHTGFDDVMIRLGAEFEYKIPTEEEFLVDARKRYKSLADAIDALSDKMEKAEIENGDDNVAHGSDLVEEKQPVEEETLAIHKIASQSEAQLRYYLAIELMTKENYDQASKLLKELIHQDGENLRYRRSYGRVLLEQKNYSDALDEFAAAIKIDPADEMSYYLRGTTYEAMEDYENALADYRIAIELKPEDEINHFRAASMLEELKSYEEALAKYRTAVELNPEDDLNHFKVGSILEKLEKHEEALTEYRVAVELNPKDEINHLKLGNVLEKLDRYDEALEEYRIAIDLNPGNEFNYFVTGNLLEKLKRYEEAIDFYNSANQIKTDSICYLALGNLYENLGRDDEAIAHYEKAVELGNQMGVCFWRLSILYDRLGRREEAIANIQKAVDIDAANAAYYETMAVILRNSGKDKEAEDAMFKATVLKQQNNV